MTTVPRPARVPLPAVAGLGIAAGLAAVSYGHIFAVALLAGAASWEAAVIAATVDGLIVMSLATIALARRHGQKPPPVAKASLLVGVAATGAANLAHGVAYGWPGVATAIWVPLVAELAYLLAMAALRIVQEAAVADRADTRPAICDHTIPVAALMVRVAAHHQEDEENATAEAAVSTRPVVRGTATPVATDIDPASEVAAEEPADIPAARPDAPVAIGDRAEAVMEWLTDPDTAITPDTATGADVVEMLAARGHGRVSARTGRRVLRDVRAAMPDESDRQLAVA
ncbi:hypothetical protein AB0I72_00380 [Nocardiopsis sp. NPDC049922]|uniref:hypothetical protein n=1 Tax=Nocardiopsis sp. NPDC049922 TaxID=3155157 RepID=UPI0033EC2650